MLGTLADMSAPQQLTQAQRDHLQTAHHMLRRREMIRHWLLSQEDLSRIEARRRGHNRLGFAVQLCLLRFPGRGLESDLVFGEQWNR